MDKENNAALIGIYLALAIVYRYPHDIRTVHEIEKLIIKLGGEVPDTNR